MAVRATGINPAMLRWAREQAGYSIEEIAGRRKVPAARVREWEAGASFPTWRQLEDLAYRDYDRATVFFFSNEPPVENTIAAEFRRLPETMLADLQPDTRYAVRQARARQADLAYLADLAELLGASGTAERFILRDLSPQAHIDNPDGLAAAVREYLGVSLDEQKSWSTPDDALKQWREQVDDAGVWVFKRSFRQQDIAGFCLGDAVFPVIYLNNGQAKVRQAFTLFHELAHLLFDFNHIERLDDSHYLVELSGADRAAEIACNRFAGEFLVPSDEFANAIAGQNGAVTGDESVSRLAGIYSVSREVILYKLRDMGRLDDAQYRQTVDRWRLERPAAAGFGGDYYATQATYLGKKYLRAAFTAFEDGDIDDFQLAGLLGVKGSSLAGLERYAWQ